jgi:hypothetical protein
LVLRRHDQRNHGSAGAETSVVKILVSKMSLCIPRCYCV